MWTSTQRGLPRARGTRTSTRGTRGRRHLLHGPGQGPGKSSSEAANAYYGAYLLALSLGDVALADWCRTLLAMEVRAARYYYHMPAGGKVYPARFADHNRVVGVLGALSTGAQTAFGPSPIYAHGIQILPVTPATEDLLKPPSFIAEDLAFLDAVLEHDAAVDDSVVVARRLRARVLGPGARLEGDDGAADRRRRRVEGVAALLDRDAAGC